MWAMATFQGETKVAPFDPSIFNIPHQRSRVRASLRQSPKIAQDFRIFCICLHVVVALCPCLHLESLKGSILEDRIR